ncbi:MAG: aldo/keto reductase [Clostridium sp.]|nr:aldo/keto reductase [Clostridium sp.]
MYTSDLSNVKTVKLNNGIEMPQIGLGTFLIPKEELKKTIGEAFRLGYRQFDTAWRYHNEREIAEALNENGIKREEVFITTKVNADALYRFKYWYGKHRFMNIRNFKSIRNAILESFDNLQTEYVDLFLVHWPWPMYLKMYKELDRLYREGRIRAIGVSSFTEGHLRSLAEVSDIVPAVNQFEISPLNTQKELINFCRKMGIQPEAMSTFSHFRSNEPRKEILENPILMDLAKTKNKSVAQIVLRWLVQQGVAIIPKTWNFHHLKENIDLFDFELSPSEMEIIDSLNQGQCLNYNPYAPHILKCIPKKYK